MKLLPVSLCALLLALSRLGAAAPRQGLADRASAAKAHRVVILKVDGLGGDLLYDTMRQIDPASGKSRLPWLSHIFVENGVIFKNFYTRGISLSAPSWSILDTGRHSIIRGNVEYDRFTGQVYDYLNFFPFYLEYARNREVDMPGAQVLDRAGIPLLIDRFPYAQRFQSFQLFQRGVRWPTLEHVLERRFSSKNLFAALESMDAPSLDEMLGQQTETELKQALHEPEIFYADFYTGDIDHMGHVTNSPAALRDALERLDALAGRTWTAITLSPVASETLFVVVSDHGMNNEPGVTSQTFSLPDLFSSAEGGGHHVVTNRVLLSDYKLKGLNPLVHRVTTPSTASFYLAGEASRYPTAWLDIDGNERAAIQLRNSDLNKLHILLLQLARTDLTPQTRRAAAECLRETVDTHRAAWTSTLDQLDQEMGALQKAIEQRQKAVGEVHQWTRGQRDEGQDKAARRLTNELGAWQREHTGYAAYVKHLRALLAFAPDTARPFHGNVADLIPPLALGDNNSVGEIERYIVGLSANGLTLDSGGKLDEDRSFRRVNYFSLLARQHARNNPQPALSPYPIDFMAMRLQGGAERYWLYGNEDNQLVVQVGNDRRISLQPVRRLMQDANGRITWEPLSWHSGIPLHLFEDPHLRIPTGADRATWLSEPHTEREWLEAVHLCHYSNGVIGVIEELSPIADHVPGAPGTDPLMLRYERRRRTLVEADFHIFAANHWNFNVRFPNPGGNHGSFFRISTHSIWMMAGGGLPAESIDEPYDSLNFASTVLNLMGRTPPMPDRVVAIH